MTPIRLQKILSPITSRRKADEYISAGRVTVNGVVAVPGTKADPQTDDIRLDGLRIKTSDSSTYIMLHKPEGVIVTARDPQGRKTIFDLLPDTIKKDGKRLFTVGRLDFDSSGLLLLTNDGDFANRLAHPSYEMKKVYIARVRGIPDTNALSAFRSGIEIDGKTTAPCQADIIKKEPNPRLRIVLHEGRNRQVRKMCEAIGHRVINLKRVAVGHLHLGDLPSGGWRYLTPQEVNQFR
jgi:23S rRNA pseudouridine2605 synthase